MMAKIRPASASAGVIRVDLDVEAAARPAPGRSPRQRQRRHHGRRRSSTRESRSSSCPSCDFQALRPPMRGAPGEQRHRQRRAAARRSGRAASLVRADALAVKKSTMMLPRRSWHHGRNSAIAAPAAAPDSSKSPTIVMPIGVAADQADAGHQRDHGQQHAGEDGAELGQRFERSARRCCSRRGGAVRIVAARSVLGRRVIAHRQARRAPRRARSGSSGGSSAGAARRSCRASRSRRPTAAAGASAHASSTIDVAGGAGQEAAAIGRDAVDAGVDRGAHQALPGACPQIVRPRPSASIRWIAIVAGMRWPRSG